MSVKLRKGGRTLVKEFEDIYITYYKDVYRFLYKTSGGSQDIAEELTQDVFLKAFQQLSSFKAESSFSTWIYRIATNVAISAVRKKKNDTIRLDESVFFNLSESQVDEALEDESEEQLQRLQRAMEKLEADERALVTLYYMEEKPLSEVAFILGMTEGNAKVKLHRIRKKLYIFIKDQE